MALNSIEIISLNIRGKSEALVSEHQSVRTAYRKLPFRDDYIELTMTGFEGDTVANKKHHGGNDKAVCCYNADHFLKWNTELGLTLEPGAFGENLTISGSEGQEDHVFIGDRYRLGEALVEISEPRGPCFVIGIRYNYKPFPVLLQQSGLTGFYLRTIEPGKVSPTDKLVHESSHPEKISVMDVNQIRYHDPRNAIMLQRLVQLKELTLDWRERFEVMLKKC